MKKVFISMPMAGKTEHDVKIKRLDVVDKILKQNPGEHIKIIDSYFRTYEQDSQRTDAGCVPLKYLAKALHYMADADLVFFADGWQDARGCRIERMAALDYGLNVMDETPEE